MKVLWNDENDNLWCCYCKERIHLGEKFIRIPQKDDEEDYNKDYHTECIPEMEDED